MPRVGPEGGVTIRDLINLVRRPEVLVLLGLAVLPCCSQELSQCVPAGDVRGRDPVFALPEGLVAVPSSEIAISGDPTWYVASPTGGVWLVSVPTGQLDDARESGSLIPLNDTAIGETGNSPDVRADPPVMAGASPTDDEAQQALACAADSAT